MFSTQSDNCIPVIHIFDTISVFAAQLEEPKIGISGKGLTTLKKKPFENIVGKQGNAGNQSCKIAAEQQRLGRPSKKPWS